MDLPQTNIGCYSKNLRCFSPSTNKSKSTCTMTVWSEHFSQNSGIPTDSSNLSSSQQTYPCIATCTHVQSLVCTMYPQQIRLSLEMQYVSCKCQLHNEQGSHAEYHEILHSRGLEINKMLFLALRLLIRARVAQHVK